MDRKTPFRIIESASARTKYDHPLALPASSGPRPAALRARQDAAPQRLAHCCRATAATLCMAVHRYTLGR